MLEKLSVLTGHDFDIEAKLGQSYLELSVQSFISKRPKISYVN